MKKILSMLTIFFAAVVLVTCERNELYNNSNDDLFSLLVKGVETPEPTAIYIYDAGLSNGNLGGRAGADALCQAVAPPPFPVTTVRAFISVSAADEIADLVPPAYHGLPVYDHSGTNTVSATWTGLWDGTINMTLSAAGVMPPGLEWWNGSNTTGTYNGASCQEWTSDLAAFTGIMGNSNFPDTNWINWGAPTCDFNNYLLCVAY